MTGRDARNASQSGASNKKKDQMRYSTIVCAFFAVSATAFGQNLIVTAEGRHGQAPPEVTRDDISDEVNKHPARIAAWVPLRGDQAALDLYIAIDDGENTDLGIQFGSLKAFINGQPAATRAGLVYLRNGSAAIVAPLSADHAQVAKALRLPLGEPGIAASPYMGISDLVKKWPADGARHEVLLISSGADPYSPRDPENPYLLTAIADAQRRGVVVHSIYYGRGNARLNWGQNFLAELGDETGGEAYWQSTQVSFDSYLDDLNQRLQNQYLLTLVPEQTKTGLEPVRVTPGSHASLKSASKVNLQSSLD
jgi:hypothetical protein